MRYLVLVCAPLLLTGCGLELLGTTAIRATSEAQQVKALQGQMGYAQSATDKINLQHALDLYVGEKGVYPPSLDALAPQYIASIPLKADGTPYGYDPRTGTILESAGNPQMDAQNLALIQHAIQQYGQTTGRYPPHLQALAPNYLQFVPTPSAGGHFLYNQQTGQVGMPMAGQGQRPSSPLAPGMTPMGEMMTGVTVRQEMNRMGNSGANRAGSYARGSVNQINNQHNQRQNQVMDQLGF